MGWASGSGLFNDVWETVRPHLRVCRGLVAFVVEGQTKNFRYDAAPALLMWMSRNELSHHPAGQRVEDLLAFAKEIITRYGP